MFHFEGILRDVEQTDAGFVSLAQYSMLNGDSTSNRNMDR